MVLYFTSNAVEPAAMLYMGKDKYESNYLILHYNHELFLIFLIQDEDLIKHGLDHDVWFHVDKYSSAHVYLRLPPTQPLSTLSTDSPDLLTDIAQLTKANSIEGNKLDSITIIYTRWGNLKKDGSMDVGQVTFHNAKEVYRIKIHQRFYKYLFI